MTTPPREPTIPLLTRIDIACDRFKKNWDSDVPVSIEQLLKDFGDAECDSALRELLAVEIELRFKRGDTFRKEDYLTRLPEHSDLVSELFDSEVDELMETTTPTQFMADALVSTKNDVDTNPHAVPEMIGKYRIVEALDRGGQATVYRAIHPELGRDVVIKFCHFGKSSDPNAEDALRSEGRVLADLEHPNLARVYDFDFHENRAYLVIEYIRGMHLGQFRKQTSPDPQVWIPIARQVAQALSYVHEQGVLHLDMKPQNILIDETGTPRLIDFGLARTETLWDQSGPNPTMLSGTLPYMAPEQARCDAENIGPKSDIFGLGGVIYFLVTGKPPIWGNDFQEVLGNAKSGNWDRDLLAGKCDEPIRKIIEKSLAIEANERFASGNELAQSLAALETKPAWSRQTIAGAGLALVACLVFVMLFLISGGDPAVVPAPIESGAMKIRVWRGGNTFDLTDSAPVSVGDRVEIRSQIPPGVNVSLFLFDSAGKLQLIDSVPEKSDSFEYRFPKDREQFEAIVGSAGTEFVFLCGRRESPVTVEELRRLGLFAGSWPKLPGDSVIQIRPTEVDFLQRGRGFGGGVDTVDPQQQVFNHLSSLRNMLEETSDFVEGIAFSHTE